MTARAPARSALGPPEDERLDACLDRKAGQDLPPTSSEGLPEVTFGKDRPVGAVAGVARCAPDASGPSSKPLTVENDVRCAARENRFEGRPPLEADFDDSPGQPIDER